MRSTEHSLTFAVFGISTLEIKMSEPTTDAMFAQFNIPGEARNRIYEVVLKLPSSSKTAILGSRLLHQEGHGIGSRYYTIPGACTKRPLLYCMV